MDSGVRKLNSHEPVAIIGIGCRFPGGINSPDAFWRILAEGQHVVGEVPATRFDLAEWFDARPAVAGRVYSRFGGFLEGIDRFDAAFFEMSPREAERLDPQQRLLLETAWEALEDAGQAPGSEGFKDTGVFVGAWLNDFEARLFRDPAIIDFHMTTGSGRYSLSGRVSHFLGLTGPSITVDAACASSLTAVALAVESLQAGRCSMALAGGVNIILQPHITIAYSQSSMMAPDGRCKFGDASANGYVRSEGAGVVALKPLSKAQAEGDPIYAIILGGALNNDGRSSRSMGTPGQAGQEDLLRKAYASAGVAANRVDYVEAHGTGTLAGDPIELAALGNLLGAGRTADRYLRVGSVKTNFGHTEGAAGIAGLIKTALSLRHAVLPASLHFQHPNPTIDWDGLGVRIQAACEPWPVTGGPRVAGVSGFGIAGSNAHVVLQEAPAPAETAGAGELAVRRPVVLPISAHSPEAARAQVGQWGEFLAGAADEQLANIAYSAACRRAHHFYRTAIVGASAEDLRRALKDAGERIRGVSAETMKVVFVFPGQGGQWQGMGAGLYRSEPVFRQAFDECAAAMQPYLDRPLVEELLADGAAAGMDRIEVIQPMMFALQASLADLLKSWGIAADAVIGHSMGEAAAAYTAGILSKADAAKLICLRSQEMKAFSGRGAMLLVGLSLNEAEQRARRFADRLSPAVCNGPQTTVLSGDPAAVEALAAELSADEVFCRILKVDVAAHSPQMDGPAARLAQMLDGLHPTPEQIAFYSTVTGSKLAGSQAGAAYWSQNLRRPVQFYQAAVCARADGLQLFLEISPHPTLINALQDIIAADRGGSIHGGAVATLQRNEDEQRALMAALGELYCRGAKIDWEKVYPQGKFVRLPAYPWQRQRYWLPAAEASAGRAGAETRFPGQPTQLADGSGQVFNLALDQAHFPWLAGCKLGGVDAAPAAAWLDLMRQAAAKVLGGSRFQLGDIEFRRVIQFPDDGTPVEIQTLVKPGGAAWRVQVFQRAGGQWELCAQSELAVDADRGDEQPVFREPHGPAAGPEGLYAILERCGIVPGKLKQAGASLWQEAGCVTLRIEGGAAPAAPLDGMLNAALAWEQASGRQGVSKPGQAFVLKQARQFIQLDDLSEAAWVQAQPGAVTLFSEALKPLAILRSPVWQARWMDGSGEPERWLFQNAWNELPEPPVMNSGQSGTWLVFCDPLGYGEQLARRFEMEGRASVRIFRGERLRQEDAKRWSVRHQSPDDLRRVIDAVAADAALAPLQGVVYCWGLDVAQDCPPDEAADGPLVLPVVHLIQGLNARRDDSRLALWLVTQAAQPVGTAADPLQAGLWGLGRVMSNEHPDWWGGILDLEPGCEPEQAARLVFAELQRPGKSFRVLRGGRCFERGLHSFDLKAVAATPYRWDPAGAYLITGGFGGVGLAAARWMVERGARRLILMARTRLPERSAWCNVPPDDPLYARIEAVRQLEDLGAQVTPACVDLAKPGELAKWLETYENQGGRAIRGVLHAAVVNEDHLLVDQNREVWRRGFLAKAQGALDLATCLPNLDFYVLFSSVIALFGPAGTGVYAAANSYLDALASQLKDQGLPAISLNWGEWKNLGLALSKSVGDTANQFDAQGIRGFSATDGMEVLGRVIDRLANRTDLPANLAVIPVDWQAYRAAASPRYGEDLFAGLLQAADQKRGPADFEESAETFIDRYFKKSIPERQLMLTGALETIIQGVFHLSGTPIDHERPLGLMGMDSLMGIEIRNQIQTTLAVKLPATFVWNYPTLAAMAARLSTLFEKEEAAAAPEVVVQPAVEAARVEPMQATMQAVLDQVNQLSDDEALLKLLAGS